MTDLRRPAGRVDEVYSGREVRSFRAIAGCEYVCGVGTHAQVDDDATVLTDLNAGTRQIIDCRLDAGRADHKIKLALAIVEKNFKWAAAAGSLDCFNADPILGLVGHRACTSELPF